jgi:AraC-like DNA-binding protein
MTLSQASMSEARVTNTGKPSNGATDHPYNIYVSNRRHVVATSNGTVILEPGDVTVADSAMALTMTTKEPYTTIGLTVPAGLLRTYISEPERVVGARFSGRTGFSKIVSYMLLTMWESAESDNFDEIGTGLAESLLSIMSTCCRVNLHHTEADNLGLIAKQERIKHIINRNLHMPDFSVGRLAKQLGFSIRYIQMLFSDGECTVSKYIRRQRLEACKRQLGDPTWLNRGQGVAATACGDELGATAEASVRRTARELRALWWTAQDHRQHRGAAAHCEDPVAPGARSGAAVPERAAAGGAGAAGAVQPAVNWTMSSDSVGG